MFNTLSMLRGLKIMQCFHGIEEHCRGELICFMKNQPTIYPGRAGPLKYAKFVFERQGRTENECCWNLIRSNYGQIHRIAIRGSVCFSHRKALLSSYIMVKNGIQKLTSIHNSVNFRKECTCQIRFLSLSLSLTSRSSHFLFAAARNTETSRATNTAEWGKTFSSSSSSYLNVFYSLFHS